MNIEDIKIGETYNIRATVVDKSPKGWIEIQAIDEKYSNILSVSAAEAFSPISPANDIKNTETAPKYDPCRTFRKGDKVYPIELNGRIFSLYWKDKIGKLLTVTKSESFDYVELPEVDGQPIDPAYLELVTPVEEQEPYIMREYCDFFAVEKDGVHYSYFLKGSYYEKTKEAAEAERDRLNADYHRGQNGTAPNS